MSKLSAIAAAAVVLFSVNAAHAHQIWIEQDARGARVHFGEFLDNLREVSPGPLDKLARISARRVAGNGSRALSLTKGKNAFALSGRAAQGQSLLAEFNHYPLFKYKEDAKEVRGIWTPAARLVTDFSARKPELILDIVPTGKLGEVRVTYKGRPLVGRKVEVIAASGWSLLRETDENGKVTFGTPWKGLYVLEVHHTDKSGGSRAGAKGAEAYDEAQFVTSLSFSLDKGYASPPNPGVHR